MGFKVSGFSAISQNYISPYVASNFYLKAPFLAALGMMTLGNNKKTSLNIGRPDSGEILSGTRLSAVRKKSLQGRNSYIPRAQGFKTNNTKVMTTRDTMPTVSSATTLSHGQATQFGSQFNWVSAKTPILIWHEDKFRAGQENTRDGQAIAMGQLIDEATQVGYQDLMDWLADAVWNGNPADQTADLWSAPLGIIQALSATNVYGGTDRADANNAVWRSQVDSTLKAVDISKIVNDANLTKKIRVQGNGINLVLTTTALYAQFKQQILSSGSGGRLLDKGLPKMADMGMTGEVLQLDNVYVMYDPTCPANNVACFDLTPWMLNVHPAMNFKVDEFTALSKYAEGAKDADQAQCHLRFILSDDNPFLACLYTAIGT